ncbi:MAG TPA: DUF3040 domain-containing protein [Micromonosporaceae bacterium]|nr:DUF3040 domain-containing protein [Micromonosporaceae bacterium]
MPLSEHEQRLFDEIEQSLAKDTKFASAVRASDPRFHAKRRIVLAVIVGVIGLTLVVLGVASAPPVSVGGFILMLAAAAFGLQAARRGRGVSTKAGGGPTPARVTKMRRSSLIDRLEERWRNREDHN